MSITTPQRNIKEENYYACSMQLRSGQGRLPIGCQCKMLVKFT